MPSANERRLQEFDWAKTPLGDRGAWPTEMHVAISMMMASGFPMCIAWGGQRIQIYNDAYSAIYGVKHPASFGAPAQESWPEIWEFLDPALDHVMTTGQTLWFAETLLPLARSTLPEECYFDFSYSPILGADGAVIGVLSVVAERTPGVVARRRQKLCELDLARDSEDTFDTLMNRLRDGLAENEMDCAQAVLYAAASEIGAPDNEIWSVRASQSFIQKMQPLAAQALLRGCIGVETGAAGTSEGQVLSIPFFTLSGDPLYALIILPHHLVPIESSAVAFAQAILARVDFALHAIEMRQRKIGQIREKIVEQEFLHRFLFESIRDGVAYCATDGAATDDEVMVAANAQLCNLLGYAADEMIGMKREAIFFPDDKDLIAALEQRSRVGHFAGEFQLRRKDGRAVPVELSSNLIELHKGQMRSLTVMRDISQRKAAEKQQTENVRLETVANLAGTLAHDTNNLMTIVIGSTEFLSETLPSGGFEQRMAMNALVAAERASALTNQLLNYARPHPPAPRQLDLNVFLAEIRPLLASALGAINTLVITYEADLPPCMADAAQLTTALLNLVTNARQAMPTSGTLSMATFLSDIATTANPSDPPPSQCVGLRVTDTGTGIPENIQDRVFEPFFTTKEVGSGSGLGLSIVRRLMDDLGGTVRMSSTPGKGTVFELCFQRAEPAAADDENGMDSFTKVKTVLYVEDNETVRHQTEGMLRLIGADLIAFATSREALDWVRKGGHADILFTDLVLPGGMSGLELAEELRRHPPDLPVLITTGYDPRTTLAKESSRHFPVLPKPYTRRALANALLRGLRGGGMVSHPGR